MGGPNSSAVWIYDSRTNHHFALKKTRDAARFVRCRAAVNLAKRKETERI